MPAPVAASSAWVVTFIAFWPLFHPAVAVADACSTDLITLVSKASLLPL